MRFRSRAGIMLATVATLAVTLGGCGHEADEASGSREGGGQASASAPPAAAKTGDRRPAFTLPDLDGAKRSISEWDGKVVLINFWASWCPPCRREIPAFMQVRDRYRDQGFEVVGVAVDQRQKAKDFADELLINYPILIAEDSGGKLMRQYGNRLGALPYSVLVDRDGQIVFSHRGELKKPQLEAELKGHL